MPKFIGVIDKRVGKIYVGGTLKKALAKAGEVMMAKEAVNHIKNGSLDVIGITTKRGNFPPDIRLLDLDEVANLDKGG